MDIAKLKQEYKELHFASMTLGERYTNEGQAKLDREVELLGILSADAGLKPYEYVWQFEKGLV